jgi:hypothetical protein
VAIEIVNVSPAECEIMVWLLIIVVFLACRSTRLWCT